MLTSVKSTTKILTPCNRSLLQISCCFTLPTGFGTNVTYRITDAIIIPPDACRKIKGEPNTSSRNFEKGILDFGTETFSFVQEKSDKDDENTNFVKALEHRDVKLHFFGKLHFRSKIQISLEYKISDVQSSLQLFPAASTKSFSVASASPMCLFSSSLRRKSSCFTCEHYNTSSLITLSSAALCFSWNSLTVMLYPGGILLYISLSYTHKK